MIFFISFGIGITYSIDSFRGKNLFSSNSVKLVLKECRSRRMNITERYLKKILSCLKIPSLQSTRVSDYFMKRKNVFENSMME